MFSKPLFPIAAALLISGIVFAQSPLTAPDAPTGATRHFDRLDANRDGVISRDEANGSKWLARQYDTVDANGDGLLTPDEFQAYVKRRLQTGPMS